MTDKGNPISNFFNRLIGRETWHEWQARVLRETPPSQSLPAIDTETGEETTIEYFPFYDGRRM